SQCDPEGGRGRVTRFGFCTRSGPIPTRRVAPIKCAPSHRFGVLDRELVSLSRPENSRQGPAEILPEIAPALDRFRKDGRLSCFPGVALPNVVRDRSDTPPGGIIVLRGRNPTGRWGARLGPARGMPGRASGGAPVGSVHSAPAK